MALIIDDNKGNLTLTAGTLIEDINGNLFIRGLVVNSDVNGNLVISSKGPLTDFIIYQDIQISDEQLRQEFINKFNAEKFQEAFAILENNSQFNTKKFVAEVLNRIADYLNVGQIGTYDKIDPFLNTLQEKYITLINQYNNQGEYDNDIIYHLYNFVNYQDLIYMYINQIPSSGIIPTNPYFWTEINLRGEKGAGGSGLILKYVWQQNVSYAVKDVVTYSGAMWVAKQANTNQTPSAGSAYWEKLVEPQNAHIDSSFSEPTEKYIGQIWIEMIN